MDFVSQRGIDHRTARNHGDQHACDIQIAHNRPLPLPTWSSKGTASWPTSDLTSFYPSWPFWETERPGTLRKTHWSLEWRFGGRFAFRFLAFFEEQCPWSSVCKRCWSRSSGISCKMSGTLITSREAKRTCSQGSRCSLMGRFCTFPRAFSLKGTSTGAQSPPSINL